MGIWWDNLKNDFWALFAFLITAKPTAQTPPQTESFDEWSIDYDYPSENEEIEVVEHQSLDCCDYCCDFHENDVDCINEIY